MKNEKKTEKTNEKKTVATEPIHFINTKDNFMWDRAREENREVWDNEKGEWVKWH